MNKCFIYKRLCGDTKNPDTRQSLILSGLELFGEYGVNGTSTRMLAKHSGANVAAISYHFGSKEGLYHEVIKHITDQAQDHIKEGYQEIAPLLEKEKLSKAEAKKIIHSLTGALLNMFLSSDEPLMWAQIIVREKIKPTAGFDIIYNSLIKNMQLATTFAIAEYLGIDKNSIEAKVRSHTIIGQVIVFLTDRECLLRHLETKALTEEHIASIKNIVSLQIDANLDNKLVQEKK